MWVEDARFHLLRALRSVGVGLAAAAWASVLSSEAQLGDETRAYVGIGASLVATLISQCVGSRPPSLANPRRPARGGSPR